MKADKIVKLFKTFAHQPTPTSALILGSPSGKDKSATIVSTWSQRNLERGKSTKFQQTHLVECESSKVVDMLPVDISFEQISSVSKSGKYRAVLREVPSEGNVSQRKQYLEVWNHHQLYQNYDLSALDMHGDVYTTGEFWSLAWSSCEHKVMYVAERKVPKSEPFYKPKAQENKESKSEEAPSKGEEYTFRSDWGELLFGKHQPVVVICDIETGLLTILEGVPPQYSPGQVVWIPNGGGIVGVAWKNEPRRLGLAYCTNRISVIFHLSLDGDFNIISGEDQAVRSPRFSPDGKYLAWLERSAGGPHHAGHKLMCASWDTKEVFVVVDLVKRQASTSNGAAFYGLYCECLPIRCWSSDSRRLVLSTPQQCHRATYIVNVEKKSITELNLNALEGSSRGSATVLDVLDDCVVMIHSSLRDCPSLVFGHLPQEGKEHSAVWLQVTKWSPPVDLQPCDLHYMQLEANNTSDSFREYNALYMGPQNKPSTSVPLIVFPHGGPHSSFTDEYSTVVTLMVQLGYGVLLVNYRGSIGQGDDSVHFLPKRVGDADVKDVHQAVSAAIKKIPSLDPQKCVLFGGSHGGFLVAHLSGQYPDSYRAVVARNPVIDIASMFGSSDIPDWCYVEAGEEFNQATVISEEALQAMRRISPILHACKVKAPTLLMLGKKDLRVPWSQGLMFYHTLHANGVITKIHLYDDVHGLSQVLVEMDNIINAMLWFEEHLT